jgi:phenylacetate-CoA ligase
MTRYFDHRETRDVAAREADLMQRLPAVLAAALATPGWVRHLGAVDPAVVTSRAALASLPVLRKSELPTLHRAEPPFGGFMPGHAGDFARLFTSPGPIFEAESVAPDPWGCGRAVFAAGFACGDVVLNTFSYHLTPGGFMMDSGARAAGCAVIPAGPGNTEKQLEVIRAYRPIGYMGVPDFLNLLIAKLDEAGEDMPFRKAFVSGAAFPKTLQEAFAARGIDAYQTYATADIGIIAYESQAREGLIVNEDLIVEIVRVGTGEPVADGEVGEVVVTLLDPKRPVIRLALGDLSAVMPGMSPCGRTNLRIKGWMGRADQACKVKGMFVRPEQVAEVARRHPSLGKVRLVVARVGDADIMTLHAEAASAADGLAEAVMDTLQAVTKLKGKVHIVPPGTLANDGKVIADERPVG